VSSRLQTGHSQALQLRLSNKNRRTARFTLHANDFCDEQRTVEVHSGGTVRIESTGPPSTVGTTSPSRTRPS
jgi:hypothetical protein